MNIEDLKSLILSLTQDVTFRYAGEYACINPWSQRKIEVGFGDVVKTYDDINDLVEDTIYNGKSLRDISEEIDIE